MSINRDASGGWGLQFPIIKESILMRKVLLVLGQNDGDAIAAKNRIARKAADIGVFDEINGCDPGGEYVHSLANAKKECNDKTRDVYQIKRELEKLADGDILVCSNCWNDIFKSNWLVRRFSCPRHVELICHRVERCALKWFNADMLRACNAALKTEMTYSMCYAYDSNGVILRKSAFTVMFVNEWMELAEEIGNRIQDSGDVRDSGQGTICQVSFTALVYRALLNLKTSNKIAMSYGDFVVGFPDLAVSLWTNNNANEIQDAPRSCTIRVLINRIFRCVAQKVERLGFRVAFGAHTKGACCKERQYRLSKGHKPKKVFITFGDGTEDIIAARKRISREAMRTGAFDEVYDYGWSDPSAEAAVHPLRNEKRGAGYWVWKPDLILRELTRLDDGDILMYSDCGNVVFKSRSWKHLLGQMEHFEFFCHKIPGCSLQWNRSELLDFFRPRLKIETPRVCFAIESGQLLFRKTPFTTRLVSEWKKILFEHPEYIRDLWDGESEKQYPSFIENRHDQSVLTLLVYEALQNVATAGKIGWFSHNYYRRGLSIVPAIFIARHKKGTPHRFSIGYVVRMLLVEIYRPIERIMELMGVQIIRCECPVPR